jgi:pimeloyl-ACP methyl ester carboxylesterase
VPHTSSNGPRIYYETRGVESGEPLVLIGGLGAQLVSWRDGFVQRLVDRGLFVILMDNRDVGMSDMTAGSGVHVADYDINAFSADVCRVLDALDLASVHIVGESMGGVIAQRMAINHPRRVRSATLFYSAPGFDVAYFGDAMDGAGSGPLVTPDMPRKAAIAAMVANEQMSASSGYPFDDAWILRCKELYYERGFRPDGVQRQAHALMKSGTWLDALPLITCPVAVVHGRADRLVRPETAFELGRRIPNAEVHIYPGMGHQVVPELWDEFVPIILRTIDRAGK